MINSILIFLFGIASGCGASYFVHKAYWKRRLAAISRSHADQIALYDGYLGSAKQQTQASVQRWIKQRESLEEENRTSLDAGVRQQQHLRQQYEAQIAKEKSDRAALQAELAQYKEDAEAQLLAAEGRALAAEAQVSAAEAKVLEEREQSINLAVERNKELNAEKQSLQSKLNDIRNQLNASVIDNNELQRLLDEVQQQCDNQLLQAYEKSGLTFAAVAEMLFPDLVFLKNSAMEIDKHQKHAARILNALKAIDNREFDNSEKVKATNKDWFESSEKPGVVRIYFHRDKPISGQCEILISDKKNQKKDFTYLKERHK